MICDMPMNIRLTSLCMTQNYFQVNGNCFKQYEGTVTFDGDGDG